ncbi:hypothetical protein D4R71_01660 [bacterium]|nr:MAG: hypothetical protein D4R71_01660 [bacterium]
MKKLIAIIAILALATSAFATESDPSETVGFVKYVCVTTAGTDLNAVALPMDAGYTNASNLGDDIGVCDVVNKWDAATQGWVSATKLPMGWTGDYAVENGYPYQINITSGVDVYIAGDLPTPPIFYLVTTSTTDLNFIMVPLTRSDLTMAGALGDDIGVCDVVNKWDSATQGWISATKLPMGWTGDYAIDIGNPLMVNVTANTTWPPPKGVTSSKIQIIKISKPTILR